MELSICRMLVRVSGLAKHFLEFIFLHLHNARGQQDMFSIIFDCLVMYMYSFISLLLYNTRNVYLKTIKQLQPKEIFKIQKKVDLKQERSKHIQLNKLDGINVVF